VNRFIGCPRGQYGRSVNDASNAFMSGNNVAVSNR
jgi:hypothetical protein